MLVAQDIRNFIDHPGIGWHNFPHPGIDRDGTSCPLNTFYYGHLRVLSELAEGEQAEELSDRADALGCAIRQTFYDGAVFHDAIKGRRVVRGYLVADERAGCVL